MHHAIKRSLRWKLTPARSITMILLLAGTTGVQAADVLDNWHQWRGPEATGHSPRGTPPVTWSETKNVRWKAPIPGEGSSTPIVWRDQVFVLTAVKTDRIDESVPPPEKQPRRPFGIKFPRNSFRFVVLSVDRATGKVRWQTTVTDEVPHEGRHSDNDFASGSPTTDGEGLYASFGSRGVYRLDLAGNIIWERRLGRMQTRRSFGEGASPVVHGDSLVVNWDHDGPSFIEVLDVRNGKTRWKKDRDEITTWSTPRVLEYKGRTHVIVSATERVRSYDLKTGEVIWDCGGQTVNVIPSPVVIDNLAICMSGYRGNAVQAISLDSKGDVSGSKGIVWSLGRGAPYVPSPLLFDDHLYFTQSNSAIVSCVNARTGNEIIPRQRLPEITRLYASPVGADGRVYFTARDGSTLVISKGKELKVLAVNRIGEPVDASAAIVGKQLFLRGSKHLFCIED